MSSRARTTANRIDRNYALRNQSLKSLSATRRPHVSPLEHRLFRLLAFCLLCWIPVPSLSERETVEISIVASPAEHRLLELTRSELDKEPSLVTDEALRQLPGFGLFRRSSSLFAQPTTAGVTLRGIRLNSTSRALVELDGIPLNDPFGGWVYWRSVPTATLERIKVLQGLGSQVVGPQALTGAVQLSSRIEVNSRLSISGGNLGTFEATAGTRAFVRRSEDGLLKAQASAQFLTTDGFFLVDSSDRGAIDQRAGSSSGVGRLIVEQTTSKGDLTKFILQGFAEERENGTALSENSTQQLIASLKRQIETHSGHRLNTDLSAQFTEFENTFSSQATDRDSEALALDQFDIPSRRFSGEISLSNEREFVRQLGASYSFLTGDTNENFFFENGTPRRLRHAGGKQHLLSLFAEGETPISPHLELQPTLRTTWWLNTDGVREIFDREDPSLDSREDFSTRSRLLIEPSLALKWKLREGLRLEFGTGLTMRSPTLNELYRPFRVRNDITVANEDLEPERLFTNELGVRYQNDRFSLSAGTFWSNLYDGVANVTLGAGNGAFLAPCGFVPDGGVCRQRRNIDRAEIFGTEIAGEIHLHRATKLDLRYLWQQSEIESGDASILGNEFPQSPPHSLTASLQMLLSEKLEAALRLQYSDRQYEDDQNSLPLSSLLQLHAHASYQLSDDYTLSAQLRNVTDERAEIGRTTDGVLSQGEPFSVVFGVEAKL